MDNIIKQVEYRGFNINFYHDSEPMNTRENDNLATMVCFHRNYNLGDDHGFHDDDDFQDWLKENKYIPGKNIFILPLYLYDHSGLSMSISGFSCQWDSGQIGWIYITAERFKAESLRYGREGKKGKQIKHITKKDKSRIDDLLRAEVKEYDQYLTGDVYGYQIEPTERNKSIDCDGSCWGFYGDEGIKYATSEAMSEIDYSIKQYRETVKKEYAKKKK